MIPEVKPERAQLYSYKQHNITYIYEFHAIRNITIMDVTQDHPDIVNIISKLLEGHGSSSSTHVKLTEAEITALCLNCKDILLSEPAVLKLEAPVKICGDTHGQYDDMLRIFEFGGFPPMSIYLFLGNYVDRGQMSLETICLLMAYKIQYQDKIFLLRGNHECSSINRIYRFHNECKTRYSINLWKTFNDTFNCLPIVAVMNDKIFCCHGGLSPDLQTIDAISAISRPVDVPDEGLLCDILWSDLDMAIPLQANLVNRHLAIFR